MGPTNSLSDGDRYVAVHDSAQFTALRDRWQKFTLSASVVFMGWWFLAILLGAFAPDFYRTSVTGSLNVGMLFALATLVLVPAIIAIYLRFARTQLDPLSERIRVDLEGDPR